MSNPAYNTYRKQLTALTTDTAILAALSVAARECAWYPSDKNWVRTYERFEPDHDPFATLIFQSHGKPQKLLHVEISEAYPHEENADDFVLRHNSLGWLCVKPFPADPVLPTLSLVLASALAASVETTVVRYWPGCRCMLRMDESVQTHFAKIYSRKFLRHDRGERLHRAVVSLWRAAERGELEFAVAEPERWDSCTLTRWQAKIAGASVAALLFGAEGENLAYRMGRAAASLTRANVEPPQIFDAPEQLSDSIACGVELSRRVPELAAEVTALLELLNTIHAATASRPLRPIHGDLQACHWIDDKAQLGLVDFDDFALGDPERDAASFLVQLEFEKHPQAQVKKLSYAFLAGYEAVAEPLDHQLLNAYMAHKRLARALKLARLLQPDGDLQAARALKLASQSLSKS